MRASCILVSILVVATGLAGAQEIDGTIGLFAQTQDFGCDAAVIAAPVGELFEIYLGIFGTSLASIAGYEVSLDGMPLIVNVTWPVPGTVWGTFDNQLVGFTEPLPVTDGEVVLATLHLLCADPGDWTPVLGPGEPSSFPGYPALADGEDLLHIVGVEPLWCSWSPDLEGTAWIHAGAVADRQTSLSTIKQLFR